MSGQIRKELPAGYYNDAYKYQYDWRCYINLADNITKQMKLTGAQNKKIIDIGCGVGWFTDHLYFNVSRDITGIDFSEKGLLHAKREFPCINFILANVYEFDYSGYEVALIMETLEHLENDKKVIEKLDKGCQVYASVPYLKERDCEAHVRIFDEKVIAERYGEYLDLKSIVQIESFIAFYGVRK